MPRHASHLLRIVQGALAVLIVACSRSNTTAARGEGADEAFEVLYGRVRSDRVGVPLGTSPRRGAKDALVTIVQFSDDACLHCRDAEMTLEQLRRAHPDELRFVYKSLRDDPALARRLGVDRVPTFFVNGIRMTGAQPLGNFERVVLAELTRARALIETGTPRERIYEAMTGGSTAARPLGDGTRGP